MLVISRKKSANTMINAMMFYNTTKEYKNLRRFIKRSFELSLVTRKPWNTLRFC